MQQTSVLYRSSDSSNDTVTMTADYDLVIIGTGAAGTSAAAAAVHMGAARVAMVERGPLWGTCVNVGCIPSKFLLTLAGHHYYRGDQQRNYGVDRQFDLGAALAGKNALIERLKEKKKDRFLDRLGIELVKGEAAFLSPGKIRVGDRTLISGRFIIATGSSPSLPPVKGMGSVPYMTSVEALDPERIPESLVVIGGRALGLEFAQLYRHFGADVTLLQRSPRIIPEEEPEISDLLAEYLRQEGVVIRTGVNPESVEKSGDQIMTTTTINGKPEKFSAECLLLATGRTPNTQELHLENAGVSTMKNGAVIVDASMRTTSPGIWAAGDVTGEPMLETAARKGGEIAAINAFSELKRSFDRSALPHGIFTSPQVASVGMTEDRASRAGLPATARNVRMDVLAKPSIIGDARGMVKIVADAASDRILGVHICSPQATEIIQQGVLAIRHRLGIQDLIDEIHTFPSLSEIISVCAREFRKNPEKGCEVPT